MTVEKNLEDILKAVEALITELKAELQSVQTANHKLQLFYNSEQLQKDCELEQRKRSTLYAQALYPLYRGYREHTITQTKEEK